MTAFAYKAFNRDGRLESGEVEAGHADDVARLLDQRGLIAVSVEEAAPKAARAPWFGGRVAAPEVTRFLADLAIMLNAGIRIDEALAIMEREFDNGRLQPVVARLRAGLAGGRSFSQALEEWPALFPAFQVAMVRVAETSGKLPTLLSRIAGERQRFEQLARGMSEALRYPAVLLLGTVAVMIFFLAGVVPQFAPIIAGAADPGSFVAAIFALSGFMRANGDLLLALAAGGLIALVLAMRRMALRRRLLSLVVRAPLISDIARSYRTARFSRLLGIMIETGISAPVAIRLICDTVDRGAGATGLAERASDAVRQGQRLSVALEMLGLPPLALRMLRIGEQSGELANLSYKVADFYEKRLERSLSRLVGFIGPATVALISILIGGVIVAIMSTLMSFNDMVR